MTGGAILGEDGRYRYLLWRDIGQTGPPGVFIMLNPSTADAQNDDPTIRRCIGFARMWGWGFMSVCNLFALRATNPDVLRNAPGDIVGPSNDHHLLMAAKAAVEQGGMVVAAWGALGRLYYRDDTVRRLLAPHMDLYAVKCSTKGDPMHPLYLPSSCLPVVYAKRSGT